MKKIFFTLFIILLCFNVHAQKVGLVLSGGGAKGLYHIGIIKALEENNIPIDYISGTSMGSIIAGLYAAGYSYDDMIYVFTHDNVSGWVSGKIDDKYKYYYNEEKVRPSLFTTSLDLKNIFESKNAIKKGGANNQGMLSGTPADIFAAGNIIPSTQLDVELMGYFAPANVASQGNFDNLFVPFRCVAADVIKKEQFIWKEGNIAQAIRSSMAIPIVFSPVIYGNKILYDGGVYNNFPWKDMEREFEPDFIIGGRCVSGEAPNIKSIMGQLELMVMHRTDYNIPEDKGLVIGRNVDIGVLDFSDPTIPIMQGYEDAMSMMDSIKSKIKRRVAAEEVERRRLEYKSTLPALEFSGSSVESLNDIISPNKQQRVLTGDTLFIDTEQKKTKKPTNRNYSFEGFKKVFYRAVTERNMKSDFPISAYDYDLGLFDVNVRLTSVPTFKLRAGLNISSSSINQAFIGFAYNDNRRNSGQYSVDAYLGSFYNSAEISTRHNFYNSRIPFYLNTTMTYNYTDFARANNQKITFNSLFKEGNYTSNDVYFSSALGVKVQKDGRAEIRFAIGSDKLKFSDKNFTTELVPQDKASVKYFTLGASISSNTFNYNAFPTRGILQNISGSIAFSKIKIDSPKPNNEYGMETRYIDNHCQWVGVSYDREQYFKVSKIFTVGYAINGAWSNIEFMGDEYVNRAFSPRYAPTNFSKTLFLPEFQEASFMAAGVMPILELNDKLYLKTGVFVYKNDILKYKELDKNIKYILEAAAVFQSPLGPISFSYNHFNVSSAKKNYWIFSFGYMIFNKRGVVY